MHFSFGSMKNTQACSLLLMDSLFRCYSPGNGVIVARKEKVVLMFVPFNRVYF